MTLSDGQCVLAEAGGSFVLQADHRLDIQGTPKIGTDRAADGIAQLNIFGTLQFTPVEGELGMLTRFHSGRFDTATPNVTTQVALAGGLQIDVSTVPSGTHILIAAQTVTS